MGEREMADQVAEMAATGPDGCPSRRGGNTNEQDIQFLRAVEATATSGISCGRGSSRRSDVSEGAEAALLDNSPQRIKQIARLNEAAMKPLECAYLGYLAEFKDIAHVDEVVLKSLKSVEQDCKAEDDVARRLREKVQKESKGLSWNYMRPKLKMKLKKPKASILSGSVFADELHHLTSQATSASSANKQFTGRTGYGDPPHPPPFHKCHVCKKQTALYYLKCCSLATCEMCWCRCYLEDMCSERVKLPLVKLEGKDILMWQSFDFPSDLILCKASGRDRTLKYFFAKIGDLMGEARMVPVKQYTFHRDGERVISCSVSNDTISRADFA